MRKQKILDNFLLSVTLIHLYKLHGHWFQFVNNLSPINFMYVLSFFFSARGPKKKIDFIKLVYSLVTSLWFHDTLASLEEQ